MNYSLSFINFARDIADVTFLTHKPGAARINYFYFFNILKILEFANCNSWCLFLCHHLFKGGEKQVNIATRHGSAT